MNNIICFVPCAPFEGSAVAHSAGICRSGVSRPWDAQPHIFMARGLAAFSRMFVQFFIFSPTRALDAGSPIVSLARILAFVFLSQYVKELFSQVYPGRLTCLRLCAPGTCLVPCSVSNRTPVSGWRVTHRA